MVELRKSKESKIDSKTTDKKSKERVCTCQAVYKKSDFVIGCDYCDEWYHGKCVGGLTEENTTGIVKYMCLPCRNSGKYDTTRLGEDAEENEGNLSSSGASKALIDQIEDLQKQAHLTRHTI